MSEQVLLVGAPHEVIELCELCDLEVVGIFDTARTGEFLGREILGDDNDATTARPSLKRIPVIITPDQPARRRRLVAHYAASGFRFRSLISPAATISRSASIGQGALIQGQCNVSVAVQLGDFVRLNTFANVMHESRVGDYTTVAPNAVILGRVAIGEQCYIGANSTILPDLAVESGATVGAGAVVTKPVAAHTTVVSVPARELVRS